MFVTTHDGRRWQVEEVRPEAALLRCVSGDVHALIEAPHDWRQLPAERVAALLEEQQLQPFVVETLVGTPAVADGPRREPDCRITVGNLRDMLSGYSAHAEITFGSTLDAVPLIFYRIKSRSLDDSLVQIELNELRPDDEL